MARVTRGGPDPSLTARVRARSVTLRRCRRRRRWSETVGAIPPPRLGSAHTALPGNSLAPAAARNFVRAALAGWAAAGGPAAAGVSERLADDAVLLASELVTNAVVHARTQVEVACRLEGAAGEDGAGLVLEVTDHHPARDVRKGVAERGGGLPEFGRGLRIVARLTDSWGITYRPRTKTIWARLPADAEPGSYLGEVPLQRGLRVAEILAPSPTRSGRGPDPEWGSRGALSFLAEASDLLAGQFDEEMVAALVCQLLVPRLADWCAVWLREDEARHRKGEEDDAVRLVRVWHSNEGRIEDLHALLEKEPPRVPRAVAGGAVPLPYPCLPDGPDLGGAALAFPLVAGGRNLGTLLIGRSGLLHFPAEVVGLLTDFGRRAALSVAAARRYTRQATISRVLQRGLLPKGVAEIPGVRTALVYEPRGEGLAGGDFYDVFPAGDGRWCFMLGDVCGNGPEAAVVTGLARPWLRLLAREGYPVADVLDRLNRLLLDDALEHAEAAARAAAVAGGSDPHLPAEGAQPRFLSLLYGELVPRPAAEGGGARCTLASAGHPLPLLLDPAGSVRPVAAPQMLLGVVEDTGYGSETFDLAPGDTLLCVTDGVTERRSGQRQFDDGDGLALALRSCAGLDAPLVAERIRRLVHGFDATPPDDDLALLVLQAVPGAG
ncbi:SpoIIE family protein phosphatase [Streptomyces sp. NPDC060194]|uniref:SpoIIE family protein phosphatase n=1 Tax=Streptomyces sp. NPDC060194 TaxID=3347069 RepID=UPI003663D849